MVTKKERLEKAYNTLVLVGKVKNKKDFAKKIGINYTSLSVAFSGNPKCLTDGLFSRIRNAFPNCFDDNWEYRVNNVESVGDQNANGQHSKVIIKEYTDTIKKLIDEMASQREQNAEFLRELLRQNSTLIETLKNKNN